MAALLLTAETLFERRMSRKTGYRFVSAMASRGGKKQVFVGKNGAQIYVAPVVILVSEYSASARRSVFCWDAGFWPREGRGQPSCGCFLDHA